MQVGIEKLQDGSQKVTAGLNTLNGKTDEMKKELTNYVMDLSK